MPDVLRGLTWDHPRGSVALRAAAARHRDRIAIEWQTQPLEGFESASIAELAADHDLLVLDHPHLGEAVDGACLVPLDELLDAAALDRIGGATIGRAAASYELAGRVYALPLDAAAQVQAVHPGLLGDREPPTSWDGILELAHALPVALSLAGPHALLSFYSICAGLTADRLGWTAEAPVPPTIGLEALDLMGRLSARAEPSLARANPIEILEAMARSRAAACCPLVFGYVTYARRLSGRERLCFCDAPGLGSTLGGTGIALTRRCPLTPELAEHLLWLLDPVTQTTFIPEHEGQPSARAAWSDRAVDAAAGGFYSGTRATLEAAWVRPRFAGYVGFQTRGSRLIREGLEQRANHARLIAELSALWRSCLPAGWSAS